MLPGIDLRNGHSAIAPNILKNYFRLIENLSGARKAGPGLNLIKLIQGLYPEIVFWHGSCSVPLIMVNKVGPYVV